MNNNEPNMAHVLARSIVLGAGKDQRVGVIVSNAEQVRTLTYELLQAIQQIPHWLYVSDDDALQWSSIQGEVRINGTTITIASGYMKFRGYTLDKLFVSGHLGEAQRIEALANLTPMMRGADRVAIF